jgi:spore maturation protein CgeB
LTKILYIGDSSSGSSSAARANALSRLGHKVVLIDPYQAFHEQLGPTWLAAFHFRTGYRFVSFGVKAWLKRIIPEYKPDLVWVNSGELFGPEAIKIIRQLPCPVILYINDDPMGLRDGHRFDSLQKAIKFYDCCVVMREINVFEFRAKGAKDVLRVHMSYDEVAHKPYESYADIPLQFHSEVAFIGTWMRHEKRDEFLLKLVQQGVSVSIWGDRWEKSPLFSKLKPHWRGRALYGRDYVAALQGAKVCLGLLSKGNRDLHTTRSLETTYAAGVLCAERTPEHLEMYREGVEAVFWSDADECAEKCKELLADDEKRERIRIAGMKRVRELKAGNENVCQTILNHIFGQEKSDGK